MIPRANITRRSFLGGLVYLGSFSFMQLGTTLDKLCTTGKTDALASKLANFYVDKGSAKAVGLEYLRSVPSEAKAGLLIDLICPFDGERRAEFAEADKQRLKELLSDRQREDFEHERVVHVRGWILSETECRLCALAAII
jgi:hypothetical protein